MHDLTKLWRIGKLGIDIIFSELTNFDKMHFR